MRRLLGFVVVPALSLMTPLLVIPLVARHGGGGAVVGVSVGQSVGFLCALMVALAWPMTGPPLVARLSESERRTLYVESIESRGVVFAVVAPVGGLFAGLLAQSFVPTAVLSAVAITANGLTAGWYYVGTGRPQGLLLYETLVRVGSSGLAAVSLALGGPIASYPLLVCAGAATSLVLNYAHVVGRSRLPHFGRRALASVRAQLRSTLARFAQGVYQAGAVSIVAAVAPGPVLAFAAYDRSQKSLLLAAQAAPDAIISWIASPMPGLLRRQRMALAADTAFAAILSLAYYATLPLLLHYMYAGLVSVPTLDRALAAVGLGMAVLTRCVLSHALVPSGRERDAASLLVGTSVAGVGLIAGGAALVGVTGALGAVVVTEVVYVAAGLARWSRSQSNRALRLEAGR